MSYEPDMPEEPRRRARKSGAVTAVAIVNFVCGGLALLCGCLVFGGGAMFSNPEFKKQLDQQMQKQGQAMDPQAKEMLESGKVGGIAMVMGGVALAVGVAIVVAGIGVLNRRAWGRILTLVLGVIWVLTNIYPLNIPGLVVAGAYCVFVFIILLNSKYAAEFA